MQYCGHIQNVTLDFMSQLNILTGYFITVKKPKKQHNKKTPNPL